MSPLLVLVALGACRIPDEHFIGLSDGGGDANMDTSDAACWSAHSSNFDPCTLTPATGDFTMTMSSTLDTSTGMLDDGTGTVTPIGELYPPEAPTYLLVHVHDFTVPATLELSIVTGSLPSPARPLLIVADDKIDIQGLLNFTDATNVVNAECVAPMTPNSTTRAPGATGGGYGGAGGIGGAGSVAAATAMAPNGSDQIVPLRLGCPGFVGGKAGSFPGGSRGKAGGGIELNARVSITIRGEIAANGGGGVTGSSTNTTINPGGGGGGSGGAILIESPMIAFNGATAKLCAVGGGGGHGSDPNIVTSDGTAGVDCSGGFGSSGTPGAGGDGGITAAGTMGGSGGTTVGGGGGGGGVGRIVLHGQVQGAPMISSPAFTMTP